MSDHQSRADMLRSHVRAFAQALYELTHPRIEVRWWPPSVRNDEAGVQQRIAAVRAGTRRIGG
ncbi:hypothetical protein ACFY19_20570 [Streptosporangium saharense]|uniref:hypothetical protein n=1 Tax=Streptosporangium saharense TaxID=1706840 RepID=UPI0036CB7CCE